MRARVRNIPIYKCVVCGVEGAVVGKGKEWTSIGGGFFLCQKQICKDEFARRPLVGRPSPPRVEPV